MQSCPHWQKMPSSRRFPSNCRKSSSINLSYRTSPCPNAAPSANSAITASSTSFCGSSTPVCNGSVYPCPKTETTRPKLCAVTVCCKSVPFRYQDWERHPVCTQLIPAVWLESRKGGGSVACWGKRSGRRESCEADGSA